MALLYTVLSFQKRDISAFQSCAGQQSRLHKAGHMVTNNTGAVLISDYNTLSQCVLSYF